MYKNEYDGSFHQLHPLKSESWHVKCNDVFFFSTDIVTWKWRRTWFTLDGWFTFRVIRVKSLRVPCYPEIIEILNIIAPSYRSLFPDKTKIFFFVNKSKFEWNSKENVFNSIKRIFYFFFALSLFLSFRDVNPCFFFFIKKPAVVSPFFFFLHFPNTLPKKKRKDSSTTWFSWKCQVREVNLSCLKAYPAIDDMPIKVSRLRVYPSNPFLCVSPRETACFPPTKIISFSY